MRTRLMVHFHALFNFRLGMLEKILCDRIQMTALHRSHQDLWNHMLDAHRLKIALSNVRVFFTHSSTLPRMLEKSCEKSCAIVSKCHHLDTIAHSLHRSHQDLWNNMLDAHRLKIALSNVRVFFTHSSILPWAR
jgi:GTP1/Obg family GTP-binding protein